MRKHLLLFFLALIFIVACSSDKKDESIIAQDKMVRILTDVHLVDGSLLVHGASDSLYKYGVNRYALVFKKYGVDSASFNKSLKYYSGQPKEIVAIYDEVGKKLSAKSDSTTKVQNAQIDKETKQKQAQAKADAKQKADSLKRDSARAGKTLRLRTDKKVL